MRSAWAAGAAAVIVPKDKSASLTPVARKTADGADDEFARHEEVVDGSRAHGHAEGHDDKFLPEFESADRTQGFGGRFLQIDFHF